MRLNNNLITLSNLVAAYKKRELYDFPVHTGSVQCFVNNTYPEYSFLMLLCISNLGQFVLYTEYHLMILSCCSTVYL